MDFLMPKLSDTMEEGTILQWLVPDGASVAKGDTIVEIESDKANMMVEAPAAGTLQIVAQVGDSLPIGAPIASIGDTPGAAQQPAEPPAESPAVAEAPTVAHDAPSAPPADIAPAGDERATGGIPTADDGTGSSIGMEVRLPETYPGAGDEAHDTPAPEVEQPPKASPGGEPVKASPLARRLAAELGVDLAAVTGTGPAGRIVREDVEAAARGTRPPEPTATPAPTAVPAAPAATAAPAGVPPSAPGERTPMTRLQRTIAKRMAMSKPGAPHFYLQRDVDVTALLALRKELVAASPEGQGPSVNDLIVRAVALAGAANPDALRQFSDDALVTPSGVHVGVAVAIPGGLLVPVVRDADRKRVPEIAAEVRDLAGRCRDGTITPPELEGSTISVSNLGMFGIDRFFAVINPPEAAILAVGRAKPTPTVVDGEIAVRDILTVTLSVDHRALYGADAAAFLAAIVERLERPGSLVL